MKLLRYGPHGQEKPGLLDAEGRVRDLSGHVADISGNTLLPDSIARLKAIDASTLPLVEGNPRLGACVAGTGKFICIGLNYSDHAAETGATVPPSRSKELTWLCLSMDHDDTARQRARFDFHDDEI